MNAKEGDGILVRVKKHASSVKEKLIFMEK